MAKVIKYKLYCTVDSQWEEVWKHENEGAPTVCPRNEAHTIDVSSITIVDEVKRESIETVPQLPEGGKRKADRGFSFDAAAGVSTSADYIIDEDLQIKGGILNCENNHIKDSVKMEILDYQFLYVGLWYPNTPTEAGIEGVEGLTWQQVTPDGVSLHDYLREFPVSKDGVTKIKNEAITTTPLNGLKIRITYNSQGATLVPCHVGIVASVD